MLNPQLVDPGFVDALENAWSVDSVYPDCRPQWSESNPSWGQCLVTSLLVRHLHGGVLETGRTDQGEWHFRNRLPDGQIVDLTWQQFPAGRTYKAHAVHTREFHDDMLNALMDETLPARLDALRERVTRAGYPIAASAADILAAFAEGEAGRQFRRLTTVPGIESARKMGFVI